MIFLTLLACGPDTLDPRALPPWTESVVLLGTATNTSVQINQSVVTELFVDIDEPTDDRDGFRYQIQSYGGDVLYERTTNGPPVVQAFLNYWSDQSGVDILESLPYLGRFPVQVPLLPGGEQVVFQYRTAPGVYEDVGRYDLARVQDDDLGVMNVQGVTTLHHSGPPSNRLDLVIIGDGYTSAELDLFASNADAVVETLLSTEPFSTYKDFLNIYRVDVASNESGASFDTINATRDTAFGSVFAVEFINQFTGQNYSSRAIFQTAQWEVAQAASNVPWDFVLVLVNTERRAGMAVHYATATTGGSNFALVAVHELGHTIGLLGDEYSSDACVRSARMGLPVNITARPRNPPWSHWINDGTELPTTGGPPGLVGSFSPAFNCSDLYRPRKNCLMNGGNNYCPVCKEQVTRRIFRYADPVDGLERSGGRAHMLSPSPNVTVEYSRDGEVFKIAPAEELVSTGSAPFTARAILAAPEVRQDPHHDLQADFSYAHLK